MYFLFFRDNRGKQYSIVESTVNYHIPFLLTQVISDNHTNSHTFVLPFYPHLCYSMFVRKTSFEWDEEKDNENQVKHGVSFAAAQQAFLDPHRVIAEDGTHSSEEDRFYCIGRVTEGILTVRFTYRSNIIRIYGAGYWRKGRRIYEDQNKIQ
jgi:uncharacterized DUF497 family protein